MLSFKNPAISIAEEKDTTAITQLLNSAYRGESSKQGWTTEAHLIEGDIRSDENEVNATMKKEGSVFLICRAADGSLSGCVNLQKHGDKVYLGMFSVNPSLQGGGIGKQLLQAAEEYTLSVGCHSIYMSVISVRKELIDWYIRNGYSDTGERKPFTEDGKTGKHLQQLEFMMLEKRITKEG